MRRPRALDLLYENGSFVAVMKPAGVPVHGGANTRTAPVLERLPHLRPVHRLDASTSGVLLLAKTARSAREAAFAWETALKTYSAIITGPWPERRVLDAALPASDGRTQEARTDVSPVVSTPEAALVRVNIATGRMHQIRRHLAGAGTPVLMDDKYGQFERNRWFRDEMRKASKPTPKHPYLHAARLRVLEIDVSAPVPTRWGHALQVLGIDPGNDLA
ncbi:MAG: RluA family pseudouridine synthase [Myxococcota bacterium]